MDIMIFLGAGIAAELVLSLLKFSYSRRGLVCWTTAAVVLVMCCGVYFAQAGEITVDLTAALRCAFGALGMIGAALLLELASPSRRRKKQKPDLPDVPGENSLNLVLVISAGILCGAAFLLLLAGEHDTAAVLLLFPAAAALRQTCYFMRRERLDFAQNASPENRRKKLTERIAGEKYNL